MDIQTYAVWIIVEVIGAHQGKYILFTPCVQVLIQWYVLCTALTQ